MGELVATLPLLVITAILLVVAAISQNWHTRRVWLLFAALCAAAVLLAVIAFFLPEGIGRPLLTIALPGLGLAYLFFSRRILLTGLKNGSVDLFKHRRGYRAGFWFGLIVLAVSLAGYHLLDIEWFEKYRHAGSAWAIIAGWELFNLRGKTSLPAEGAPDSA